MSGDSTVPCGPGTTLAESLLHATTPAQVAGVLMDEAKVFSGSDTCLLWSSQWPEAIDGLPVDWPSNPLAAAAAIGGVEAGRTGVDVRRDVHLLCDTDACVAVLHAKNPPDSFATTLLAAEVRMAEVLAIQRLRDTVDQLAQSEKLQRALFAIADMAGSDLNMSDLLRGLHRIVGELMYAENFFIALYDRISDSIRFLYFADSVDEQELSGVELPLVRILHGPTWWTIREGKPLMGDDDELRAQVSGPMSAHGADSLDWLSVPILRDGLVKGVVVVQSYLPDKDFTHSDMALLTFVAGHILTALERKLGQEELEKRVDERTHALAESNEQLRQEVA